MIEKDYIELMHKEIDGVIEPQEKEKLRAYLNSNEKAAHYYQDLVHTVDLLQKVPEVNPPGNLKSRILDSLDWRRYQSRKKAFPQISFSWDWVFKPGYKLAYSFAAGVLIGMLILVVIFSLANVTETLDTNDLTGTIGVDAKKGVKTLQHIPVQSDEISGGLHLRESNDFIILDVNLDSQLNSELLLEYQPSDYQFRGIQQNRSNGIVIEEAGDLLKISNAEGAIYQIYFSKMSSKPTSMNLKISVSNRVLLHRDIFVDDH